MKPNAIMQDINAYYNKERRYWYLNTNVKIVDVVAVDDAYGENGMPSRMLRAMSNLPLWVAEGAITRRMHFLMCRGGGALSARFSQRTTLWTTASYT